MKKIFFVCILLSSLAFASNIFQGSTWTMAGNNSLVASFSGDDALFINPAGLYNNITSYQEYNLDTEKNTYEQNKVSVFTWKNFTFAYQSIQTLTQNSKEYQYLGFGQNNKQFYWGIAYKHIPKLISPGWALDVGFLFPLSKENILIGMSGINLFKEKSITLPRQLNLGASTSFFKEALILNTQYSYTMENNTSIYSACATFNPSYFISLRLGVNNDSYSGGASLIIPYSKLFYSMVVPFDQNLTSTYSLGFIANPF